MPDRRGFDSPVVIKVATFVKTKAEAQALIKELTGKDVAVNSDEVFVVGFDKGSIGGRYFMFTLETGGKVYASANQTEPLNPESTVLYLSFKSGLDTNFVDGVKSNEKVDLKTGDVVLNVYETDKQTKDVFPTGLKLIKSKTIHID